MINPKTNLEDGRYPYTYACDLIRGYAGYGKDGTKISRSDASQIRQGIAEIIGMPDEELAKKLAYHYVFNEESLTEKSVRDFLQAQEYYNSKR